MTLKAAKADLLTTCLVNAGCSPEGAHGTVGWLALKTCHESFGFYWGDGKVAIKWPPIKCGACSSCPVPLPPSSPSWKQELQAPLPALRLHLRPWRPLDSGKPHPGRYGEGTLPFAFRVQPQAEGEARWAEGPPEGGWWVVGPASLPPACLGGQSGAEPSLEWKKTDADPAPSEATASRSPRNQAVLK